MGASSQLILFQLKYLKYCRAAG